MTPEQWQKIDRVWQAVLARPEPERAAAIVELAAGDEALRRDVESLLVHLSRANAAGFGAAPLEVRAPRPFLVGHQLGPYTVNALLGVGGMGEVYRAHDATLGRDVAIKILPEPWLTSPDRRARFEREARLLASLNHPNIGAIYGVHENDPSTSSGQAGVRALILELVEGETLAERIARQATDAAPRGLAMSDVVPIAKQLTAALEAAHDRGIVHRDLKPANVKVTPDMRVKVLDFGLARAITGSDPDLPSGQPAIVTDTGVGVLLGTAAYMSPEQARGRPVDKRTDIWAFGCVLYEMLSGVQAFGGADIAESLANVIRAEPDWRRLPPDTPRGIRVCLRRCLQKDPDQRIHDIADVRLAMEDAFDAAGGDVDEGGRTRWSPWGVAYAGWVVAAVAVVAATAVIIPALRRDPADPPRAVPGSNPPVLLSPSAGGGGGTATAKTIQEAIDRVARGGTVQMLPGTYVETLKITKGLTLQSAGERTGPVIIAPQDSPESVIEVATTEPVTLRGLTLRVPGLHGIRGEGGVNLSVLRSTLISVNPPDGTGQLIGVTNDSQVTGVRARVLVQDNSIDGAIPKLPRFEARPRIIGVHLRGDLDGVIERNIVRRTGDVCLHVGIRSDLGGETNVDIVNNDIDECHPVARVGAILVGSPSVLNLSPDRPITAIGVVNIVGNTLRNSSEDCLTAAIMFDLFRGRIERNRIVDFVQPCATQTTRNLPAAIWLGLKGPGIPPVPAVAPTVRFNDIQGNARAGLRLASNQKIAIDASCNYWGSERGPSGIGPGDGDLILVEPGAATPEFVPFAKMPVARQPKPGC